MLGHARQHLFLQCHNCKHVHPKQKQAYLSACGVTTLVLPVASPYLPTWCRLTCHPTQGAHHLLQQGLVLGQLLGLAPASSKGHTWAADSNRTKKISAYADADRFSPTRGNESTPSSNHSQQPNLAPLLSLCCDPPTYLATSATTSRAVSRVAISRLLQKHRQHIQE
jgi:hypothetical protein